MTRAVFLTQLSEILVTDVAALQPEAPLAGFKGWDSMGRMAALTLVDTDVGVTVPLDWLDQCHTVGQLLALVEPRLEK